MTIFIDENMAPVLSEGFNLLQRHESLKYRFKEPVEVKSLRTEFGQGMDDEEWIPKLRGMNACVITQDYNIHRTKHQRQLCKEHGVGMFYFRPPSKNGFLYWDMLTMMVKHWPEIMKTTSKQKPPFSYKVTSKSSKLEPMED